jgi:type I restriction enzyme M protein
MRKCGIPFEKKFIDLTDKELSTTIETYHNWQQENWTKTYTNIPE